MINFSFLLRSLGKISKIVSPLAVLRWCVSFGSGALSVFCALSSSALFSTCLMISMIRLSVFSTLFALASLCAAVQINITSPITSTGARSARISPETRVRAQPKSRITQSEDGRVLQSPQQPEANLARAVCFIESRVSCAYLNPTQNELERERERKRSALSFKASRPLLYSSVGSWSGQTPFWCFQNSTQSSWRTLSARAARLLNVSKHSPSILANLLRLSDGSSRPSWPHIAVSLIRNSLHIRRTSSYSRFSHAASRGQPFFLPTISLEHLEGRDAAIPGTVLLLHRLELRRCLKVRFFPSHTTIDHHFIPLGPRRIDSSYRSMPGSGCKLM